MSRPLIEPGWYRAGPGGLEWAAALDDPPPEDERRDLVKVETGETVTQEPLW